MVIFDPLVYPMDTAWLDGKVPADHYRHSRPEYYRALERAHLVEPFIECAARGDKNGISDAPKDNGAPLGTGD